MTPQSPAAPWTARAVRLSCKSRKYATIAALAGAPLILIATPRALSQDLPLRAVINGHHVQPRDDQLRAIGHPDVTPAEAAEIDRLYSDLMRSEGPHRGPRDRARADRQAAAAHVELHARHAAPRAAVHQGMNAAEVARAATPGG